MPKNVTAAAVFLSIKKCKSKPPLRCKNLCADGGGCDSFCVVFFFFFGCSFRRFFVVSTVLFLPQKCSFHVPSPRSYNLHFSSGLSATVCARPLGAVLTGFARLVFGFFGGQRRQHQAAPSACLIARAERRQHN